MKPVLSIFIAFAPAAQASREIYLTSHETFTTRQGPLEANNISFMQLLFEPLQSMSQWMDVFLQVHLITISVY